MPIPQNKERNWKKGSTMEYTMDWLSNDVCEGFANVDISCTNSYSSTMYKPNNMSPVYDEAGKIYQGVNYGSRGGQDASVTSNGMNMNGVVDIPDGSNSVIPSGRNNGILHDGNMNGIMPKNGKINENMCLMNGNMYSQEQWGSTTTQSKKYCREDLKPTIEMLNGNVNMADSSTSDTSLYMENYSAKKREQKRRPKPKDGTVLLCQICGDRALGYNFDAITCESCKAFFRRNAIKTKVFTCSFEGNCKLDPHTRKFCSGCRLKKCVDVGMKKEWILSDDQLAKRRKKSEHSPSSSDDRQFLSPTDPHMTLPPHLGGAPPPMGYPPPHKIDLYSPTGSSSDGEINSTSYMSDSTENSSLSSPQAAPYLSFSPSMVKKEHNEESYTFRPVPPEIVLEIQKLEMEYRSVFDAGYSVDQAKKMVEKPHNANDLFNMTDIFIRRLIKFAKHIPEFKELKQEDQIFLLKGGIMEIMVLRSAMGFDPQNLKWKLKAQQSIKEDEHKIDPSIIREHLGASMYQDHVQFVRGLHMLTRSDRTVMTLMFVIEIFSPDRANLKNIEAVTKAQEKYTTWLQHYLESIMSVQEAQDLYPKLLMKMLEVRNLGESSAKLASNLDISKLEPLLIEVFSLQK
ncbi:vitamin D3 receptor-like isoform X1 [Mya arenaria]|uniref:vitamin D3 receptor-like isoform X1 n=1 Tax=Mya arenaria TaxID=6604 RepID=UPI0022E74881|nr:vitamin D3 receptor-like isoform X1 [Mya arenaria]